MNGAYVVVVINRFNEKKNISMNWAKDAQISISPNFEENLYDLQNLWTGEILTNIEIGQSIWEGELESHQNWAFKLIPTNNRTI